MAPREYALNPTLISVAVAACFTAGLACANPTGPQVVNGAATFQNPNASTLSVTNTPGSIINWQGFSIGAGEVTRFIQQSSSSSVLNRVVTGDVSQIYGQLLSNGRVFLLNPGGILVGPGAIVDTAGFVASTLNMVDADFIAGKLKFQGDANSGSIVNQGWIRTGYGGKVVLVAPHIENSGLIHTPGGELILAAGQKLTVSSLDHEGVQFEVQAPTDSVLNLGKLLADGGAVGVFAGTLKHSGDIRANSLVYDQAGQVVLLATNEIQLTAGSTTTADGRIGGSVTVQAAGGLDRVAGTVSAQGSSGKGGDIKILGERVALVENAVVNASGVSGGGQVLIGGDLQGGNAAVQNSNNTFVGAGAAVRADATGAGDGGRIIVWSDDKAQFYGTLSAQGGPDGGNGGFAEVSGKQSLVFAGGANLGAPKGKLGSLLLDPIDLFVDAQGGLNPDIINESTDFPSNAATVSPDTLKNIVGNVTLFASRYMRINSAIDLTTTAGEFPTATPGKGLTAQVGTWPDATTPLAATDPLNLSVGTVPNQLDIGANITTANGAVSLSAPRIQTFAASTIATAGGAISLTAPQIFASALTLDAGAGAVTGTASSGVLQLNAITSSGSVTLASTGSSLSIGNIGSTGAVALTSDNFVSTGAVTTGGGSFTATSSGSGFSTFSTIDTRAGGTGPTGGAVSITAPSSVSTRSILGGSGNITLSGSNLSNSSSAPLDTTGTVTLTASAGGMSNFKINNASGVTANSTSSTGSAFVNLSSDTALNANTVTATTTQCSTNGFCSSASINLSGELGVNVGTVTATAPTNFTILASPSFGAAYADERFESINSSVNVSSNAGPIRAQSATSLIMANNVTLGTTPFSITGGGGGIGTSATPVRVDARSNFTFNPNGEFNTQLVGTTGPNALNMQIGVAATGQSYTGTLVKTGQINLNVSASDTTVTASTFNISGGFDTRISNTSPSVRLYVPNGNLVATTVNVPKGDQVGILSPSARRNCDVFGGLSCPPQPTIEGLPVQLWADKDLTVASYTRGVGTLAKSTDFRSFNGSVTLGTIAASRDPVTVTSAKDITITDLSSIGSVSISSTPAFANTGNVTLTRVSTGGSAFVGANAGNVTIGLIDTLSGTGAVTVNASGTVQAAPNVNGVEIQSAGTISVTGGTGVLSDTASPLDIIGPAISLTTSAGGAIGSANKAVVARTQELTVNAGATFNISTDTANIHNLTLTASPSGVGASGLARITSNGQNYDFASDGTGFTLGGTNFPAAVPAAQFAGGTLSFTATSGNLTLNALDFSASNGSFSATTRGSLADITQTALQMINLGTGTLTLKADRNVVLESVNAGGMSIANATSISGSGCNSSFGPCGVTSFTANQTLTDTSNGNGTWSVTSRGAITTGALQVAGVGFTTNATGNVTAGAIGTAAKPATSVTISTTGSAGNIQTGVIEANAVSLSARGNVVVASGTTASDPAINASKIDAASIALLSQTGTVTVNGALNASNVTITAPTAITTGNINAAAPSPTSITFNSTSSVDITTGSLDAKSVVAQSACSFFYCPPGDIIVNGSIGANTKATTISLDGRAGSALTVTGAVSLDPAVSTNLYMESSGAVMLGGPVTAGTDPSLRILAGTTLTGTALASLGAVTAGAGSSIELRAGNSDTATPFQFTNIDAGASGSVTITAPAGIIQTLAGGSGGGVTAGTVSLSASATGSKIEGPSGFAPLPLTLRDTFDLTLYSGGSMNIDRTGASGAPLLSNLDITRSSAFASFGLTGFASGQSVSITSDTIGGGTNVDVLNTSATPLNFSYRNYDGINGKLTGNGIVTKGGNLYLYATGNLTTGAINTKSGSDPTVPDGSVTLQAGQALNVSGTVDSGAGSTSVQGDAISGTGQLVSTNSVFAEAFSGNVGASTSPLAISSPSVTLYAIGTAPSGNAFAALTATTDLTIYATDGFSVSSNVPLATVDLTTYGTGTGPVSLASTAAQSFGLARNGAAVEISAVASTPALGSFGLNVQNGDIRVKGGIAADALNLSTSGTLTLDGATSALTLANATQNLSASTLTIQGDVTASATTSQSMYGGTTLSFTGTGTLSSGGSQSLSSSGSLNVTSQGGPITVSALNQSLFANGNIGVTAAGGPININATDQNIFAYGNLDFTASGGAIAIQAADQSVGGYTTSVMTLQGGAGAGQSVTFTGTSQQQIYTYDNAAASIKLLGGSNTGASASIVYTGTGTQWVQAGNIVLTGGGAAGASAVISTATGSQRVRATANITLTANAAPAQIVSTSGQEQRVGESEFIPFCCSEPYQTDNITLQGGNGAEASIVASGLQRIQADNSLQLLGGTGAGGKARIESTSSTAEQRIGCGASGAGESCSTNLNTLTIAAGASGAFAEIVAAGTQRMRATSNVALTGHDDNGGYARISAAGPLQRIQFGNTVMTAGKGAGSNVEIVHTGTGPTNEDTQLLNFGNLTLAGGGTAGANTAVARISATDTRTDRSAQRISASTVTLTGGAGPDSIARITVPGTQDLSFSVLNMNGGTGGGSFAKIDTAASQNLSASSITLTAGGVGEATVANSGAIIEGQSQNIFGSSITLKGGAGTSGSTSDAVLRNLSGNQAVSGSTFTLQGGHQFSTTGFLNTGTGTSAGTQTISASSITLLSDPVVAPAHSDAFVRIENQPATNQTIFGRLALTNSGAGLVAITSAGNQSITASSGGIALNALATGSTEVTAAGTQTIRAQYVDVLTGAGSTGNAKLAATGNQWIRTTSEATSPDPTRTVPAALPDYGLRVAAFGSGTASIESGASQLLEVTYPQMMQTTGLAAGVIVGGTQAGTAVAGTSRIKAIDQNIFAGTIWVETGATNSLSEIKATNDQVISTLNGGIRILGGAGDNTLAQIDPVNQTIVVNGGIDVVGGSGVNAVAQILNGTGAQTLLATNGNIALTGGTGVGANALITSGGLQTVGASGTIALTSTPGGGSASISPLGNVPPGCAAPCILTTVASGGSIIAETFATNPVVDQFDELIELTGTTLMAEDTTILTRRAPICR
jgi:filamentous hemagglutinin family protein